MRVSAQIWALGLAGLLPFVASAAVAQLDEGQRPVAILALLAYGAIILSFLGGTWWGRRFDRNDGPGLVLAVLPSIWAWFSVLAWQAVQPQVGLAAMASGFVAVHLYDWHLTRRGFWPWRYLTLRSVLTTGALASLGAGALA